MRERENMREGGEGGREEEEDLLLVLLGVGTVVGVAAGTSGQ